MDDENNENNAFLNDHPELLEYPDSHFPMRVSVTLDGATEIFGMIHIDDNRGDMKFTPDKGIVPKWPIKQTGDTIELWDAKIECQSHCLQSAVLKSAFSIFGMDLTASAIEFGETPTLVSKVFAYTNVERSGVVDTVGTIDGCKVSVRGIMRPEVAEGSFSSDGWELKFTPPASGDVVRRLLLMIGVLIRLAAREWVGWRRIVMFDDAGKCATDIHDARFPPVEYRDWMINLLDVQNITSILEIAARLTLSPETAVEDAIALLREIRLKRYYSVLHLIGAALMFERLAAISSSKHPDWKRSGFNWMDSGKNRVSFKARLEWLFTSSSLPSSLVDDVAIIRNSISHGENFDLPLAGNIHVQRALAHLAFLCILGICGFKGKYHAFTVSNMHCSFPKDVSIDIDRIRKPIADYAAEIRANQ